MKPGEVYFAHIDETRPHRVVVISREELNAGDWVVVIPATSKLVEKRRRLANCVFIPRDTPGFNTDCVLRCEFLATIPKEDIDFETGRLGVLGAGRMRDIVRAVGNVMSAACEPV